MPMQLDTHHPPPNIIAQLKCNSDTVRITFSLEELQII